MPKKSVKKIKIQSYVLPHMFEQIQAIADKNESTISDIIVASLFQYLSTHGDKQKLFVEEADERKEYRNKLMDSITTYTDMEKSKYELNDGHRTHFNTYLSLNGLSEYRNFNLTYTDIDDDRDFLEMLMSDMELRLLKFEETYGEMK